MSRRRRHRGGLVIVAVLVVGLGALLLTTGLLFLTSAEVAAAGAAAGSAQSRSLTWSGLQAVMAVLGNQRAQVLRGERPQVDGQYVLYENATRLGVVRLLPVSADGDALDAEAGKIDVNRADAAALVRTGSFDEETAARIIAFRDAAPAKAFVSLNELLQMDGARLDDLYGPLDEVALLDSWSMDGSVRSGSRRGIEAARPRGWVDVLTVHAAEPAVTRAGKPRININQPWSESMENAVTSELGKPFATLLKAMLDSGTKFESEGSILAALLPLQVPPAEWMTVADVLTTQPGLYHIGRLDLNTATYEALMTLPGTEPEQAARIVPDRLSLSADERGSVLWPVSRGIMSLEQMQALAGKVTTRSACWRVRLACGEVDASDPEGELLMPMIVEAVIDLCDASPRLAYLRDLSMFETALTLASLNAEDEESMLVDAEDSVAAVEADPQPDSAADGMPADSPTPAEADAAAEPPDPNGEEASEETSEGAGESEGEGGDSPEVGEEGASGVSGGAAPSGGPGRIGRWSPFGG